MQLRMQSPTVSWIMIRVNIQVNAGSNVVSGGGGKQRWMSVVSSVSLFGVFTDQSKVFPNKCSCLG